MKKKLFSLLLILSFSTTVLSALTQEETTFMTKLSDYLEREFKERQKLAEELLTLLPPELADTGAKAVADAQEATRKCIEKLKLTYFTIALEMKEADPNTPLTPESLFSKLPLDTQRKSLIDCWEDYLKGPGLEWIKHFASYFIAKTEDPRGLLAAANADPEKVAFLERLGLKKFVAELIDMEEAKRSKATEESHLQEQHATNLAAELKNIQA